MLIQLTSPNGSAVLVNVNNIIRAAPSRVEPAYYEVWLTSNELLTVREDAATISRRAAAAR